MCVRVHVCTLAAHSPLPPLTPAYPFPRFTALGCFVTHFIYPGKLSVSEEVHVNECSLKHFIKLSLRPVGMIVLQPLGQDWREEAKTKDHSSALTKAGAGKA